MISKILLSLTPAFLFLVMPFAIMGFLKLVGLGKKGRRSPLTRQLLRSPGESLRAQIQDLTVNIDVYLIMTCTMPLVFFSTYLSQMHLGGNKDNIASIIIYATAAVFVTGFFAVNLLRLLKKRRSLYLALDCELAVGQELNHLMQHGYRVYHDFPADKFNIDHVVIGPKGVFAVETKGRPKRNEKGGQGEAKVIFDGKTLKFPSWSETKPIEQALRQGVWLSEWLASAIGEPVKVIPVLALPGWYIVNEKSSNIVTFSGKNPAYILKAGNDSLSDNVIQRISHQIEQKCRDVKPTAYSR